jgi:hypothetical protein
MKWILSDKMTEFEDYMPSLPSRSGGNFVYIIN